MRWLAFVLAAAVSASSAGCAAALAALPDIIAAVVDGAGVIDLIEQLVARYFVAHPDAEAQRKVDEAVQRCRLALNAALHAARGAKDVDDAAIDKAFDEFKAAYLELVRLTRPYGVRMGAGHALRAAPGELEVPEPAALAPRRR